LIVEELITILGLRQDPKAAGVASNFGTMLKGLAGFAATAGAALIGVTAAVRTYALGQSEAIDAMADFADVVGINVERLQELEYAQKLSGGTAESLRADIERLQETMVDARTGKFNEGLSQLGIAATDASGKVRTADELLVAIAKSMEGMSKQRQSQFAKALRITPDTLRLLQRGEAGIAGLSKEARSLGLILDRQAVEKSGQFGDALDRVKAITDAVGKSISVGLLPSMTLAAQGFADWVLLNREWISTGIKQVIDGVGQGFSMFGKVIKSIVGTISDFIGATSPLNENLDVTQAVAIATAVALGAMAIAALAATWPFLAITAAVVAVVVVLEDLYTAFTGGESVIGSWAKSFSEAYPNISGLLSLLGEFLGFIASKIPGALKALAGLMASQFDGVISAIETFVGLIESALSGIVKLSSAVMKVGKFLGAPLSFAANLGGNVAGMMSNQSVPAPAGVVSDAASRTVQGGDRNVTIQVNGAGDPRAVANEVVSRSGMGSTLQQSRPGMYGVGIG